MKNKKILIVDDNYKNIQVLGNILSEEGYEIEYAMNGENAIDIVMNENFDLILLDIMMPGMDGFATCQQIRKNESLNNIPIIFLTAKTNLESTVKGFKVGGQDYITKPFRILELLARVRTHLELKESKEKLCDINKILENQVLERTKELRLAKEEIEELDNTKTEFLNIISHEIRTPLNGILGFLQLHQKVIGDDSAKPFMDILEHSCNRLSEFANKALEITYIKTKGDKILKLENNSLTDIVEKVLGKFQNKINEKHLLITNQCSADTIIADLEMLSKSISLVLENSIIHSPHNSELVVKTIYANKEIVLEISDKGPGFPKSILTTGAKSFISPEHIDKNPGLDLYLSRLIAELHGGSMHVSNRDGAVVQLHLPAKG